MIHSYGLGLNGKFNWLVYTLTLTDIGAIGIICEAIVKHTEGFVYFSI